MSIYCTMACIEGVLLDPVYTGRAFGGLLDLIRRGVFGPDEQVLFWHTGGTAGLFGLWESDGRGCIESRVL